MADSIRLKFLGVRGIHPAPEIRNQATGGNTSCLMLDDGKDLIFINAGFGINSFGDAPLAEASPVGVKFQCAILFSDFLWDSTMGLPSFGPMHHKSSKIRILTGSSVNYATTALDETSSHLFSPFAGLKSLPAKTSIEQVVTNIRYGNWSIAALTMPHPLATEGATIWRIQHDQGFDAGFALLCDNSDESLAKVASFLHGCQLLVCAASTSPESDQWDMHRTGFAEALSLALACKTNSLYLTQFHPEMSDHALQRELIKLQATLGALQASDTATKLDIHLATELESFQPAFAAIQRKSS